MNIPLLLGVAMLLLLVFLITRIAVNALIQAGQSLRGISCFAVFRCATTEIAPGKL